MFFLNIIQYVHLVFMRPISRHLCTNARRSDGASSSAARRSMRSSRSLGTFNRTLDEMLRQRPYVGGQERLDVPYRGGFEVTNASGPRLDSGRRDRNLRVLLDGRRRRPPLQVGAQSRIVGLAWRRERVHPVLRAEEKFQALRRPHILDAKRQDDELFVHRSLNLAPHLGRIVAARGQHQDHRACQRYGVDDLCRPIRCGRDVARRDPTANPLRFEPRHHLEGALAIRLRVADEYVSLHGATARAGAAPCRDSCACD